MRLTYFMRTHTHRVKGEANIIRLFNINIWALLFIDDDIQKLNWFHSQRQCLGSAANSEEGVFWKEK